MWAQVIEQFGAPEVFKLMDIPKPKIQAGHVIIEVHASSVNPIDYKIRQGGAYSMAAPPFPAVLQGDVAGVVTEGVTQFKVGDAVYGFAGGMWGLSGALAQYMLADAKLIAHKPAAFSMTQAAGLALVAITAWERLFVHAIYAALPLLCNIRREEYGTILTQVAKLVDAGHLQVLIDQEYPFSQVSAAHARAQSGKAVGKVVLYQDLG